MVISTVLERNPELNFIQTLNLDDVCMIQVASLTCDVRVN